MAAINVCARTGRVIFNRTPSAKCLVNSQTTRHLLLVGRVVPSCLSYWPPALHQSSSSHLPVSVRYQSTTSTPSAPSAVSSGKDEEFRDRYIPMTRKTLIQHLLQEPIFLTDEEKKLFETFSLALDGAVISRHRGLLAELKSLFDPINPDKDTIESRQYNRRERLDQEFWLLQKLATIMEKANFHELPKAIVEKTLREHNVGGVRVSVHPEKYDVIRYWVVGKTRIRSPHDPWYQTLLKRVKATVSSSSDSTHYYKRVVIAVRLKKDDRLFLKAFREVPLNRLDQLLPAGSVRMSNLDQRLLMAAAGVGLGGVLAKIVSGLLHVEANWTLALAGVSAAAAAKVWTSYKNRQQLHLVELSKTLYFKNIINNRGLLTLLMGKAEDEIFKEVLLTYAFLLTTRPPSAREKDSVKQTSEELGSMPSSLLQDKVSDWMNFKTGTPINFDPTEGIELLSDLGILTRDKDDNLHVLPLKLSLKNLPQTGHTLSSRIEEYDLIEGFEVERSILEETEVEYTLADKLRKRFGWF